MNGKATGPFPARKNLRISPASPQRGPTADERGLLGRLLAAERARYLLDPEAARALVAVGQAQVPEGALVARAAWTQVCRGLRNQHGTVTRP